MNELLKGDNSELTMSSREIADLVEVRHDNVRRTVLRLADKGVITLPPLEEKPSSGGRPSFEYAIGKRDSYVIVAQLSPEFTARLVDRWQELERQAANEAFELPGSYAEALRLAADKTEQVEHLESENDRLNSVCNDLAENLQAGITPVQFCRQLNGVNTQKVQGALVERGYLIATRYGYRTPSQHRDRLFKECRTEKGGTTYEKVILTRQGAKLMYSLYEKGQLPMKRTWDGRYSHEIYEPGFLDMLADVEGF